MKIQVAMEFYHCGLSMDCQLSAGSLTLSLIDLIQCDTNKYAAPEAKFFEKDFDTGCFWRVLHSIMTGLVGPRPGWPHRNHSNSNSRISP